uniref:Pheromone-binding protein-related protein 6 n=1 Tax=Zeugodacus cucurbitae TaxID=28588 RepID=A0A0A1WG51_ZEUCU
MSQASNMKANFGYFVVILVFVCYASAEDESVDCTKPPRFIPLEMCCPEPDLSTKELMEQCAEYAGQSHPYQCLIECILNKTEVLGGNGEPDVDKFSALLDTTVKDNEEMAAIMEEAFETCTEKLSELKTKIAEKMSQNPEYAEKMANHRMQAGCLPYGAVLMNCVHTETFENCPASVWNDSTECNTVRDFINECKRV